VRLLERRSLLDRMADRLHDTASRRHVQLTIGAEGVIAEDLGSTNGTFVNDRPLTRPVLLRPGDVVAVGRSVLEARA